MTKINKMNKMLENISEKARINFISNASKKTLKKIPKKYVINAIEFYEKKARENGDEGKFYDAARIAEKAGLYLRSIEYHLRSSYQCSQIISLAKEHGLINETIKIYEKILGEINPNNVVIGLLKPKDNQKYKDYSWSAGFFCRDSDINKLKEAVKFYGRGCFFEPAAEVAEKAGMLEKAVDLFERNGDYDRAAYMAKEAGMLEKALELYSQSEFVDEAAEVADKLGEKDLARKLRQKFIKDKVKHGEFGVEFERAAEAAEKLGIKSLAKELYNRAIKKYEKDVELSDAAEVANKLGKKELARELYTKEMKQYESWGDFEEAMKIAKKIGLKDKVATYKELIKLEA